MHPLNGIHVQREQLIDFFITLQKGRSLEIFEVLQFRITDFLDIVLTASLLYYGYKLLKGTVAINIFIGLVLVWAFWNITELLGMQMISRVVGGFIQVGFVVLIVVFQQEIRKFLLLIGSTNFASRMQFLRFFNFLKPELNETDHAQVDVILRACEKMGSEKTGALIVIERRNSLDFVKTTGDKMNIEITQPIIESIFFKNSPLHDGAAVIQGNHITATRVILPVSNDRSIPLKFGLRHRAAVGITERTDALCLVVSEETGNLVYIRDKEFVPYQSLEELSSIIKQDLS